MVLIQTHHSRTPGVFEHHDPWIDNNGPTADPAGIWFRPSKNPKERVRSRHRVFFVAQVHVPVDCLARNRATPGRFDSEAPQKVQIVSWKLKKNVGLGSTNWIRWTISSLALTGGYRLPLADPVYSPVDIQGMCRKRRIKRKRDTGSRV